MTHKHLTDVLVIGGGGAGLCAAIAAAEAGAQVTLATKGVIDGRTNTTIIGRWITRSTPDSADELFYEIVHAGGFINDQRLVETFVEQIPLRLPRLLDYGVLITPGNPERTNLPDHWVVERVHGHTTGYGLTHYLWQRAKELGVRVLEQCAVIDLHTHDGQVVGASLADLATGDRLVVSAKSTILATGGGAAAFARHDNASDTTGDGFALAARAGAALIDLEFVSYWVASQTVDLIRSLGDAEPPSSLYGTGNCHYFLGGLRIDTQAQTTLPGLYAAGEVTGGLFGAARLGGSAVADVLVFGGIAGESAAARARDGAVGQPDAGQVTQAADMLSSWAARGGESPAPLKDELARILWHDVGLHKTRDTLLRAERSLSDVARRLAQMRVAAPAELQSALEARNILEMARLLVEASLAREETRGSYWRSDYPQPDGDFANVNVVVRADGQRCRATASPVVRTRLTEPDDPPIAAGCYSYTR